MARVEIFLELDGGAEMMIREVSSIPLTGGVQAASLVQAAYLKAMGALGLTSSTPEQEAAALAADTAEPEKKS